MDYRVVVKLDPCYFRQAKADTLLEVPIYVSEVLKWSPELTLRELRDKIVKHGVFLTH